MKTIPLSALLVPIVLSGCAAPVPVAENFPITYQKVARTAHHWDVVAEDVVTQTSGALLSHPALRSRPVLISPAQQNTAFNVAFHNFLTTQMVSKGLPVNVCKDTTRQVGFAQEASAVEVQYDVQLVRRRASNPLYRPGDLTALAAGVVVARSIAVSHFDGAEGSVLGLGLAALTDGWLGTRAQPTKTEIIVTTTIAENNRFIMRRNDIYYVPDQDAHLYITHSGYPSPCAPVRAAGSQAPAMADVERSRQEMFEASMRVSNPLWQAGY